MIFVWGNQDESRPVDRPRIPPPRNRSDDVQSSQQVMMASIMVQGFQLPRRRSYEFIILIKVGIMLPRIRGRSWRPRKWAGMTPCRVIEEWWGMINDHDPVSCILSMNSSSGDSIRCLEHTTHRVVHTPYSIHTQFTHPWTLLALHPRASFWASDHRCTLHAFHTLETPRGAQ